MKYPAWICADCGRKYGRVIPGHLATYHYPDGEDECGWCKDKTKPLTEPRDFGYPPR